MQWKFPILHFVLKSRSIKICITCHLSSIILQDLFISGSDSDMEPLSFIMVETFMRFITMSFQVSISQVLHEVFLLFYVVVSFGADILTGHLLYQRSCRCRWVKPSFFDPAFAVSIVLVWAIICFPMERASETLWTNDAVGLYVVTVIIGHYLDMLHKAST